MESVLSDPNIWVSFFSLTAMEIVLGIDNIVFIALIVGHLPDKEQKNARTVGITLALLMRIGLLFGVAFIVGLKEPLFSIFSHALSGKDILMLAGGLFLMAKGTSSIHDEVTGDMKENCKTYSGGFVSSISQIVLIDIIFSFDSVITAVGLTDNIPVIIAAMSIAMIAMLAFSGMISDFVSRYPTIKMLALSFILIIGIFLVAEGLNFHVPKGYIYFAMAFSLSVEILNLLVRKRKIKKA